MTSDKRPPLFEDLPEPANDTFVPVGVALDAIARRLRKPLKIKAPMRVVSLEKKP